MGRLTPGGACRHDWYVLVRPGTYVFPTRLHAALQRRRPGRPVAVGAVGRPAAGQADTLARGLVALSSGALAKLSRPPDPRTWSQPSCADRASGLRAWGDCTDLSPQEMVLADLGRWVGQHGVPCVG